MYEMDKKITIVGAGSHFTLGLLGDLYRVNDLWGSELMLYDIDEERARAMEKIIRRDVEHRDADLSVNATSDKTEALENSDFTIVAIRAGGLRALRKFLEIPLRHGILQVVGDTVGPSGILKGLFEIPAILEIAETLEDLSPKALMINFTNPMTPICMSVLKATKIKTVGLCHGVYDIIRLASKLLDLEFDKIKLEAGGINHLTWVTSMKYGKTEILDDFNRAVLEGRRWDIIKAHPYIVGRQLLKAYKHPATASDRHIAEFFHYLYEWFRDPEISNILKKISRYIDYEKLTLSDKIIEDAEARWRWLLRAARGEIPVEVKPSYESAMDIISSVVNDKRRELIAVNLPNDSYIDEVSDGYVVEVPGIVDGNGVRGKPIGRLSTPVSTILNMHLKKFELLVQGILEESKDLVLEAIAIDPLTTSPEKAEVILKEFLEEARDLLAIDLK
ncbi:hypothetical protein J7L70_02215 [Candidatus Bathyarchaeota archaeon]|nr:hypothetical protein [Candidatus Bathyarchaeota archaeon]